MFISGPYAEYIVYICLKIIQHQVVVSNMFYFHPYSGKITTLTNIFEMGWNHQLEYHFSKNSEERIGPSSLLPGSPKKGTHRGQWSHSRFDTPNTFDESKSCTCQWMSTVDWRHCYVLENPMMSRFCFQGSYYYVILHLTLRWMISSIICKLWIYLYIYIF